MANTVQYSTTIVLPLLVVFMSFRTRQLCLCDGASTFGCREKERKALLQFKDDLNDTHDLLSSWVGQDCCIWSGVTCSKSTRHVTRLDLNYEGVQIQGREISPSLLALQELTYLDLQFINFSGADIPKFIGSFKRLKYLDLSRASLYGTVPSELGNLSKLRYLDLSWNYIYPDYSNKLEIVDSSWLSRLSSLVYLDLSNLVVKNASSALESLSMLPLLSELHLFGSLASIPHHVNFTSLTLLDLSMNFVNTTTPAWPFEIGTLKHLDLSFNEFVGHFPSTISNFTSLEYLDISFNEFIEDGILAAATGVAKLSNLSTFAWSGSNLRGQLPLWLGDLKKLKSLDLTSNSLSGSIPSYPLPELEILDLTSNQLNGAPLESLGQLGKLVELYLSSNSFDGALTEAHFRNLTSLRHLALSDNPTLKFDILPEWTPPPKLATMFLSNCTIGPSFPTWLRKMNNVTLIDMSNATISDELPEWFGNFSSNIRLVDLSNNMIKGKLPAHSLRHLNAGYLDLSNNHLEGPFPQFSAKIKMLSLASNSISGQLPPNIGELMPNLSHLSLSSNKLSGNIPSSICKMEELKFLDLSENKLSGEMPNCFGYTNSNFEVMILGKNNLSGSISTFICSMPNLLYLLLEENHFSGELPLCLANCISLKILNLGHNNLNGSIPTWMGNNLVYLEKLSLGSNMFNGEIPSNLGRLQALDVIDLSDNMLSGPIPQSFANMSNMKISHDIGGDELLDSYTQVDDKKGINLGKKLNMESYTSQMSVVMKGRVEEFGELLTSLVSMDLSDNNLSGEIPEGLTTLVGLQNLNLSWNHLTGMIPRNITRLQSLESLDLSFNNLTGDIPSSMTSLSFLAVMNFSFNNLSGRIPTGGQFGNHPDPSIYIGNANLCGFPLGSCGGSVTSHPHRMINNEDASNKEEVWFYLSMALGFVFGFWVLVGTLLLKRKWRITYYLYIDSMYDKLYVFMSINLVRVKMLRVMGSIK